MPSDNQTLALQSLLGSGVGAGIGAGVGAGTAALLSKSENRKEEAKKWARKGAIGGAISGGLYPIARRGLHYGGSKYIEEQQQKALSSKDPLARLEMFKDIAQKRELIEGMDRPMPTGALIKRTARNAGIQSAAGVAKNRVGMGIRAGASGLASVIRKKMGKGNTDSQGDSKTASLAFSSRRMYEGDIEGLKQANDPFASKGQPPMEDPRERKARRLAELLKRAMPTGTGEGSASPTPKRGTP